MVATAGACRLDRPRLQSRLSTLKVVTVSFVATSVLCWPGSRRAERVETPRLGRRCNRQRRVVRRESSGQLARRAEACRSRSRCCGNTREERECRRGERLGEKRLRKKGNSLPGAADFATVEGGASREREPCVRARWCAGCRHSSEGAATSRVRSRGILAEAAPVILERRVGAFDKIGQRSVLAKTCKRKECPERRRRGAKEVSMLTYSRSQNKATQTCFCGLISETLFHREWG